MSKALEGLTIALFVLLILLPLWLIYQASRLADINRA
jgi:hypothetical protein